MEVFADWPRLPDDRWRPHTDSAGQCDFPDGQFLDRLGQFLRWSCYRYLGKLFTYEVGVQEEHHLVTSGPYSVIRHPSYSGIMMIITGFLIWQGSPESWMRESGILELRAGKVAAVASVTWLGLLGLYFQQQRSGPQN